MIYKSVIFYMSASQALSQFIFKNPWLTRLITTSAIGHYNIKYVRFMFSH